MSYLLDTNVISELRKGKRCDPGVASWFTDVSSEDLYLSVLTFGEIRKGIEKLQRRDPPAAESLESWLTRLVAAYSERAFPVDQAVVAGLPSCTNPSRGFHWMPSGIATAIGATRSCTP